jgi:hypothetical protein
LSKVVYYDRNRPGGASRRNVPAPALIPSPNAVVVDSSEWTGFTPYRERTAPANAELFEANTQLFDSYSLANDDLADLMNRWRQRALSQPL